MKFSDMTDGELIKLWQHLNLIKRFKNSRSLKEILIENNEAIDWEQVDMMEKDLDAEIDKRAL